MDPLAPEEKLGLNPRWLIANRDQMDAIFRDALEVPALSSEQESGSEQAVILVHRAKQNAIKQFAARGLKRFESGLLEDDQHTDDSGALVNRISGIMGVSERQAQRYLRTLGLAKDPGDDPEGPTPQILAGNTENSSRKLVHDIGLDHLLLLSTGYGADFHELVPRPYQFICNTSSLLLSMKVQAIKSQEKQREAELKQKALFPLLYWTGFAQQPTPIEKITPESSMSLYGLYLWKSGMLSPSTVQKGNDCFFNRERLAELIFLAVRETPWVFPEFVGTRPNLQADVQVEYDNAIEAMIRNVAFSVGKALLSKPPYTRKLFAKSS